METSKNGGVAEWSNALVLKTRVSKGTVSSNLTPSANPLKKILTVAQLLSQDFIEKHAIPSNIVYGKAIYDRGAVKIIEFGGMIESRHGLADWMEKLLKAEAQSEESNLLRQ
jgi:hypothetical protein